MEILKLVITGTLGAAGFAVLFSIKRIHIPFAAIGGALSTLVYAILTAAGIGLFVSNFVASLACVIYSAVMARVLKTPSMVLISASVIPLAPGGSLFYTMSNIILGNYAAATIYGMNTLKVALGIAGGIAVESLIVGIINKIITVKKGQKSM
jgi:uncharacterized membrane protein YjjB (DUF3815 family)